MRPLSLLYHFYLQVFEGIDVLLIQHPLETQRQVLNLRPIHLHILDLLGAEVKKCYIPDG